MSEEQYLYKSDINNILKIISNIHNKPEIFIKELVSNSCIAFNKLKSLNPEIDISSLNIKIQSDINTKEISFTDNAIGLDKDDLSKYIGTIGFSHNIDSENNSNLQNSGIGILSTSNVADKLTIITKKENELAYKFETEYDGRYIISEYDNLSINRGTKIILKLKENSEQFSDIYYIKNCIKVYCDYIEYPILLWITQNKIEEIDIEYDSLDDEYIKNHMNEEEENSYETRINVIEKNDWIKVNFCECIWNMTPEKVTENKLKNLYYNLTKNLDNYLLYKFINFESNIKGVIFIPSETTIDIVNDIDTMSEKPTNVSLYSNGILVYENIPNILPDWLNFIHGIIDINDTQLNISKDNIDQNLIIKIRNDLINQIIDMINDIPNEKSERFFQNYNNNLKIGITINNNLFNRIFPLIRYKTNLSNNYQKIHECIHELNVYYYLCNDFDLSKDSPFLEYYNDKQIPVIIMDDPVDNYLIYNDIELDFKLVNILYYTFNNEDKNTFQYQSLLKSFQKKLSNKVSDIIISNRLINSISCIYSKEWNENIYQINNSQFLYRNNIQYKPKNLILELNPNHEIIINSNELILSNPTYNLDSVIDFIYYNSLINCNLYGIIQKDISLMNIVFENILQQNLLQRNIKKKEIVIDNNDGDNFTDT